MQQPQKTFTGRPGKHKTRLSVRLADRISSALITVGGIGTILAVSLVFVLLVWVVGPLFRSAAITHESTAPLTNRSREPLRMGVDEYQVLGWSLYDDGTLSSFRLDNGQVIHQTRLLDGEATISAASLTPGADDIVLGLSDGSIRLGTLKFETRFIASDDLPESVRDLEIGHVATLEHRVIQLTPQRQYRAQEVAAQLHAPVSVGASAVVQLDHIVTNQGPLIAALTADGKIQLVRIRENQNFLTGETTQEASLTPLPQSESRSDLPDHIVLTGRGDNLCAAWSDGYLVRYDLRNPDEIRVAEELDLLEDREGARLTTIRLALGRGTLLVGDSEGHVDAWFRARSPDAKTSDGTWLLPIHRLEPGPTEVTSIGISKRSRMLAVGYADGRVRVYHATTDQLLLEKQLPGADPIVQVMLAPKDNGLFAATSTKLWRADFDPGYPEATLASLFLPVWYEGYEKPDMVWQSSFAGVDSEMKLGLWPLVFGTLKATVYSMMFGAPLALLAAIYTSEFIHRRARTHVKSLIEIMASLPSVVLGFLAALVIAPIIERVVPTMLCTFATIPLAFLLGAFLWQLLPQYTALVLQRFRLLFITIALAFGLWAAWLLGPLAERWFFAGDMVLWLDKQKGTGAGAWLLMFLPLCSLLTAAGVILWVNPYLRRRSGTWSRRKFAAVNLVKFLAAALLTFVVAALISQALAGANLDPRGTYVGTYVQRNALIVGFVMGFAIIPIIYTIAEDALCTVPEHLRSASLGAGATPWQTAVRIVIPTAMSGLFSALMIGLGRAVGETMIVLMAAGNTPVRDWNIFNGFRTLSANIAVELPEAVRDSTHYRTLFLAALTLFVLTFCVNTMAELVRLKFRKRAVQL